MAALAADLINALVGAILAASPLRRVKPPPRIEAKDLLLRFQSRAPRPEARTPSPAADNPEAARAEKVAQIRAKLEAAFPRKRKAES